MTSPTLGLVGRAICERFGLSEERLRVGLGADADAARVAFAWVADMVCEADNQVVALWLGLPPLAMEALLAEAEAARNNIATAEALDEIALGCIAEVMVRERKGGSERPDRAPHEIAAELVKRNGIVSASELRTLAAAYIGLEQSAIASTSNTDVMRAACNVAHAQRRFNQNQYGSGEAASRRALDAAVQALALLPQLSTLAKGGLHGKEVQDNRR